MPIVQLETHDELFGQAKLAAELKVSLEAFIVSVLTDHIAMRRRIERLRKASSHVTREGFLKILRKAPDVEPEPNNRIE